MIYYLALQLLANAVLYVLIARLLHRRLDKLACPFDVQVRRAVEQTTLIGELLARLDRVEVELKERPKRRPRTQERIRVPDEDR